MAAELGVSERQMRRYEHELARHGVLARSVADNGWRGRTRGHTLGLDLSPAIDNWTYFSGVVAEAEAYEASRHEAHVLIRMTRRRVREMICVLPDPLIRQRAMARLNTIDSDFSPVLRRTASLENLTAYRAALLAFEDLLCACGDPSAGGDRGGKLEGSEAQSVSRNHSDVRRTGHGGPMPIQPIQPSSNDSCKAGYSGPAKTKASDNSLGRVTDPQPGGFGDGLESRPGGGISIVHPALRLALTPRKIATSLMSEDFEMYLNAFRDTDEAIVCFLRELEITPAAWAEAVDTMGWYDAFLSLCVIDRNRFHSETPVVSPGGALRRFTKLYAAGHLRLTRSILSIIERDKAGLQPRARIRRQPGA